MTCSNAKRKIAAHLDNALLAEERWDFVQHLAGCRECAGELQRYQVLRQALRALPQRKVPAQLTMRLRVAASHHRRYSLEPMTWLEKLGFSLGNAMRPLGVPVFGGLCAAILLFSSLLPTFTIPRVSSDVPAVVFTKPILKSMAPLGFATDAEVDVNLDAQGRVVNWSIVDPKVRSAAMQMAIENSLLFTQFAPASVAPNSCVDCATPTSGTIRVAFRPAANIEVRD